MNFLAALEKLTAAFDEADVHYALIGGFAMALRGVQRATVDLDFILLEHCASTGRLPNWDLINDYLDIFQLASKLKEMKEWYEAPDER